MQNFKKHERLLSNKVILNLVTGGFSFFLYPFRIKWNFSSEHPLIKSKILISVPKKRLKKANKRNLVSRRIRESYRILKEENFYPKLTGIQIDFMVIYSANEVLDYKTIENKMAAVLECLTSNAKKDEIHSNLINKRS